MIKRFFYILIGALLLSQMAFYNMFPLTYSDTGTYVISGFTNMVPQDRPILYGLFLRHISMAETLWLVIFTQAFIVSYLIYCFVQEYVKRFNKDIFFFITILVLVFCTGISQKICTLIPDIFAATAGLSLILLCVKTNLKKIQIVCIGLIFVISNVVHYTHGYIAILTLIVVMLLTLFKKLDNTYLSWKRGLALISLTVFSLLLTPTIHYFFKAGFEGSRGKHVFMVGKLIQDGVLIDFLRKNCDKNEYILCPCRDSIQYGDFLWGSESPLMRTGGWLHSEVEYTKMIKGVFNSPHHLMMFAYKSIECSFVQFFNYEVNVDAENDPQGMGSLPWLVIDQHYNHQANEYLASKQNRKSLNYKELNERQNVLILFSLITVIIVLFNRKKLPPELFIILIVCIFFLIFNAVICGALSVPNSRYQSRVIWLLPLVTGVIVLNNITRIKETISKFFNNKNISSEFN